jgi:spore photoproduct lyase
MLNDYVDYKDVVKAEVIFLTHNKFKHEYNIKNNLSGEQLLWVPKIQESKISQYGGVNIRYKANLKASYIAQFKELHDNIIPWNTIRYIF